MPELIFSFVEHNGGIFPVVKSEDPGSRRYRDYLGEMLIEDVGEHTCAGLLEKLSDVESGKVEETDYAGNGWITVIKRDGVTIAHQYVDSYQDEALGHFTLREFRTAVEAWCRFLAMDKTATVKIEL